MAYIINAVRTPRGRGKMGKGALNNIHPHELLAQTLNQLHWSTSINLQNPGDFAHYGAPLITAANTVLLPVKKNSTNLNFKFVIYFNIFYVFCTSVNIYYKSYHDKLRNEFLFLINIIRKVNNNKLH